MAFLQRRLASTIQQLGQLNQKFDFPNTSQAEFHVGARLRFVSQLGVNLSLHIAQLTYALRIQMALIHKGLNQRQKFFAEATVAGHRTRFDERHSLPRLPQTRVIRFIGQEGERQLPLRTLRTQAQVDTERLPLRPLAPNQCRETACQG